MKIAVLATMLVVTAVLVSPLSAQGLGTINGTVTDPSGALVPLAKVKVVNQGTGLVRETQSNQQGFFVVPSLPPAPYDVSIESPGFVISTQRGVVLQADQSLTINVSLQLARGTQEITVEAAATQVNISNATLSQVVEQKRMVDLPLNGRNAATLALLAPGTIQAPSGNSDQGVYKTFPSAVTISANGSRNNQTAFRMDGANNNDTYTNVNQPFPFPDALQEFSVQTSNYTARYGGTSGGVVNIITKSGSNEFHGNLFEFVRNAQFNARNSFATRRDQLKRNQFGGTIGGPVELPGYSGKNKTFFFFGYQGTRIRNVQNGLSAFVPTAANRGGDFSALLDAANSGNPFGRVVAVNDPLTGKPFAGNLIPVTRFDPASVKFLNYLPNAGGTGLVYYSQPLAQNFNSFLARGDHSFSDKNRLTARYYLDRFRNRSYLDQNNYVNVASGSTIDSHNALLSDSHVIRPNLLNDLRIGMARVYSLGGPPDNTISVADLGLPIYQPAQFQKSLDGLSVSGYFNISDFPPAIFARNNYTLSDDVSWVHGRHTIAFGVGIERGQVMLRNGYQAYGSFSFTTDYTNNAAASFLLGKMRTFRQGYGEFKDNRNKYLGLYFQDDFHAGRQLTLNLGVRWEPFFPWEEIRGRIEQFRVENYRANIRSKVYVNAPPGLLFPGDDGMPQYGVVGNRGNIAPRLGFAYDLFGDGKTSIRGGSGIFYDAQQIGILNNRFVDVTPFSSQITLTDPSGPFSNPYSGIPSPFPAPWPPPKDAVFPAPVLAVTFDPANGSKMATPVTYIWNLALEQQIGKEWIARAAYVGSRSTHQTETIELNPAIYDPASKLGTDDRRMFKGFSNIGQGAQDLNSRYHSLQLSLQRRFSRGLTVMANYTWSKSLDTVPWGQGVAGIASQNLSPVPWYLPGRHQMDYGRSDFDRRQRFVLSYVWELPKFKASAPVVHYALGGWQVNGILAAQTGGPLTILAGRDAALTGLGQDRAQYLGGATYGSGACKNIAPCVDYLNTAAFGYPATGDWGNMGKSSLTGPSFFNWDFGLFRTIPLRGEKLSLRFQAEFFNLSNRVNLSNPNQTVSAAAFGSIRGAGDPRIGQLALKLLF